MGEADKKPLEDSNKQTLKEMKFAGQGKLGCTHCAWREGGR